MPAYSHDAPHFARRDVRHGWLNLARILAGVVSLAGALIVAARLDGRLPPDALPRAFGGIVAGGLFVFSVMMVSVGRDVSRRWVEFGAALGFRPALRRPFLDLGTDRPVLAGRIGRHPARIRLGTTRRGNGVAEWMQVEIDLVGVDPRAWVHFDLDPLGPGDADLASLIEASDPRCIARLSRVLEAFLDHGPHITRLRLEDGRLALRAPFLGFSREDSIELLRGAAEAADALEADAGTEAVIQG